MFATWIRQIRQKLINRHTRNSRRNFIPGVETLEDKIVPSTMEPTFVVMHDSGGSHGNLATPAISGYTPLQLRTAYGVNNILIGGSLGTGAGQTIAIVDAYNDPNIAGDLDTFDQQFTTTSATGPTLYSQYGAASSFLTVYNENGQAINPSSTSVPVDTTGGWEMEESLDVEWAHSIAPGAKIVLIEANSSSGSDLYTAVQSAAKLSGVSVVTMSWGSPDAAGESSSDSVFTTPAGHQGVTFLASTGDQSVGEYPAFSPNVIAVGGTTLTLTASNTIQSETAWSTGSDSYAPADGTGGGTSAYEAEPAYQESVQSTGFRTIPDVAFDADPSTGVAVYDSYDNSGWVQVGGTSLASPSFAGIMAIANQGRVAEGLSTFNSSSNPQQALTALYSMPSSDFNDITVGSITGGGHTYSAGPGYDEVSGLGSPVANNLVAGLASYGSGSQTASELGFTTEPPTSISVGAAFITVVQLENSSGIAVSQSGVTVTLTLSSGTFSTGSTTATAVTNSLGQASFSPIINTVGTNDTVTASATGLGTVQSSSFQVTANAAASELAFTTEPPVSVAAGATFTSVVQLETSSGAAVAESGVTVTVILWSSSGTELATGSAVTSSAGQASFNVSESTAGTGYYLTASATGLTTAQSSTFQVTAVASASKLAFTTEPPVSVAAGATFTTVAQLETSSGGAVAESGVNVTVILWSSSGTELATGSAVTNSAGQVSFNVSEATAGTGYYLTASATGLTTAKSSTFQVTASTNKLAFTTEPPVSVAAGTTFTAVIQLENSSGTAIAESGVTVSVALWSSTGRELAAGSALTNSAGQVSFNVSESTAGSGYYLTASASGFTTGQSTAFTVTSKRAVLGGNGAFLAQSLGGAATSQTNTHFSSSFAPASQAAPTTTSASSASVPAPANTWQGSYLAYALQQFLDGTADDLLMARRF